MAEAVLPPPLPPPPPQPTKLATLKSAASKSAFGVRIVNMFFLPFSFLMDACLAFKVDQTGGSLMP
jgi:uncharacterized protein YceK